MLCLFKILTKVSVYMFYQFICLCTKGLGSKIFVLFKFLNSFLVSCNVSSADNLCKQLGPRSGQTERRSLAGSKLFDTLMVFLKDFLNRLILKQISRQVNIR